MFWTAVHCLFCDVLTDEVQVIKVKNIESMTQWETKIALSLQEVQVTEHKIVVNV